MAFADLQKGFAVCNRDCCGRGRRRAAKLVHDRRFWKAQPLKKKPILFACVAVVASLGAFIFWPVEREPIQLDSHRFFVDEMGVRKHVVTGADVFVFAMEHEDGAFTVSDAEAIELAGRVFCHLSTFERTKDALASSKTATILFRTYDWKIGRFGV